MQELKNGGTIEVKPIAESSFAACDFAGCPRVAVLEVGYDHRQHTMALWLCRECAKSLAVALLGTPAGHTL
jgi:hypothetical protein